MTLSLLAIRHAPTDWNRDKKLQGQTDIPVNANELEKARNRHIPDHYKSIAWYCSPLRRTRETAEALGLNYQIEPLLVEMHWGDWEGKRVVDLRNQLGDRMIQEELRGLDMQPPNGETPRQVQARVLHWLESLPATGTIGLVTHKGVIRALISAALDWNMTGKSPIKPNWDRSLKFEWNKRTGLNPTVINLDW